MLFKVRHMKLSYVTLCFGKYCISYLVIKPFFLHMCLLSCYLYSKLTDRIFSTWKKLEGRLISLEIVCFNEEEKLSLSSCLLFKVNGTITGEFYSKIFH